MTATIHYLFTVAQYLTHVFPRATSNENSTSTFTTSV